MSGADHAHLCRTDQLLLTAPVSITGIVVGKYLALLTIFAIPTAVCGVYPLVLSQFGTVPMLETYATLLAFFLLGAACLAVGMFFSSITENQVIAFVATVVTLLVSYLMDGLKTFVTSGSTAGLVLFTALAIAAGALAWYFTKSWLLGGGVFVLLELVLAGVTLLRNSAISSAFDAVLSAVTLFSRFDGFLSGTLDLTAYLYLITVAVLFNFFTVQTLEKRRWS